MQIEWATGEAAGPLRVRARCSVQMDRWEEVGEDGELDPQVR